jgi:hypothetical protein
VTTISKKQNLHAKFFTNNKPVELTDYEAGLSHATSTEVSSQNSDEVSGSKAEKRKYQRYLEVRDSSNDVMHCDVCRKAGPDIADKTKFVTEKKKV